MTAETTCPHCGKSLRPKETFDPQVIEATIIAYTAKLGAELREELREELKRKLKKRLQKERSLRHGDANPVDRAGRS